MLKLLKGGQVFLNGKFEETDLFIVQNKIEKIGSVDERWLLQNDLEVEIIDCKNSYVTPGFVDSQIHLVGGSGESGFLSQPPRISFHECILGGITTVVGAIGVDTITRTMTNLFASVRAYREAGLSAYAYAGGYEIPPATLTGDIRKDIMFIDEIIGSGEVAIADRRAPEPTADQLARLVVDSYNAGLLSKKAGVTRIHVGEGKRRLAVIREMLERHEIILESLYLTHIERSEKLVDEAVQLARHGAYVDFDIHERDIEIWYKYYLKQDGRLDRLSFSTDAGACGPSEFFQEIQKCSRDYYSLEQMLPHVTSIPADALKLSQKGRLGKGMDADILVFNQKDLELTHVLANGNFFLKANNFAFKDEKYTARRGQDWYGIRNEK